MTGTVQPGSALRAEALDAILASLEPELTAFLAGQRERRADLMARDDIVGVQARLHPAVEAFMACYAHETLRDAARRNTPIRRIEGAIATLANLADQVALNLAHHTGQSREACTRIARRMLDYLAAPGRVSTGSFVGTLAAASA